MDYSFLRSLVLENQVPDFKIHGKKSWENTGVNLREVLIEEYVRKLFQLVTHFKSTINRQLIQEDWLLKKKNTQTVEGYVKQPKYL